PSDAGNARLRALRQPLLFAILGPRRLHAMSRESRSFRGESEMMRAPEILSRIAWSSELHPDTIVEIEDAILALDRRAFGGNGRPEVNALGMHAKLEAFIVKTGSAAAVGRMCGLSRTYMADARSGRRPVPDALALLLGYERRPHGRTIWMEKPKEDKPTGAKS
ncbi:MAG TPA: hypothetical protein VL017_02245, partial [Devosia sp.]|nr:hypothetical protein [Devosia sp.]